MPWDSDEAVSPNGTRYVVNARRLGVSQGPPVGPFGLVWTGLSWLLHRTWYRGRWFVEVSPARGGGGLWVSGPVADDDAASATVDEAMRLIREGLWPPRGNEAT